jgi:uncharacterized membrane protein YqiK
MDPLLISLAWTVGILVVTVLVLFGLHQWTGILRYIPNDKIGVVEKLFSFRGSLDSGFIALNGEPGFQAEVLRGGLHFFLPFFYRVHKMPLLTIAQGRIGYVFARDGAPLEPAQTLGKNTDQEDFQDVRKFLANGGQKGPQRRLLREGTYAINLAQFIVLTETEIHGIALDDMTAQTLASMSQTLKERHGFEPVVIRDADDKIGVVTVHDGPSLPSGEIIAPEVGGANRVAMVIDPETEKELADLRRLAGIQTKDPTPKPMPVKQTISHDNFQKSEVFIEAGGFRGRQLQTLVEGTYFINRLFATVEYIAKTTVEIGNVGVVISYAGETGDNKLSSDYRHGQLVDRGKRGVWAEPLLPGKYAFNTFAGKVVMVPTTNFMLRWDNSSEVQSSHRLDDNLSEISLITQDAFEPILPLSVVLHIDYQKAPELVQRFGDIKRLVEQTLDPMVSSYFKNQAQKKTLIQLLQQRTEIQEQAGEDMKTRFSAYTLEFQEVLIGTPRPKPGDTTIETILLQLRQRQVAAEQIETYKSKQLAAAQERELNEAQATAERQTSLTQSKVQIEIETNKGAAAVALATKKAEEVRITAEAERNKRSLEGEGEANAITAVGNANATATKAQVDAYGGPQFRLAEQIAIRMFEAVEHGHQALVPQTVVIGGSGDGGQVMNPGGLVAGLLANMLPKATTEPVQEVIPPTKGMNGHGASAG